MERVTDCMESDRQQQLNLFLSQHETRAYKMAYALTRNRDDALELVQDSMLKLVHKYADKPAEEWKSLFFRILQNCIRDFQRRKSVSRLFSIFLPATEHDKQTIIEQAPAAEKNNPQQTLEQINSLEHISAALGTLPSRQQQTFLLRAWLEFSVRETANILSISEGSVKTHYSRAQAQLRKLLGDSL